jgi:small-conductance mechanosensitive channel
LSRKPSAIQPTVAEQFILERSFSSALLLALVSVPFVYSGGNPQILRLAVIPGLMPVLILSPAIFAPRLRVGFYFFTVIYLLDFLRNYLPPQWLLARLLLLSVAVFGTVGIALLLRAQKRESAAANVPSGAIRPLLCIGMLLFIGSLGANVAGNLTIAELLVSPLVRVLFLGAAIRLGAVVATTFALMALRTPLALLSRMVRDRGEAAAMQVRRMVNLAATGLWIYMALVNLGLVPDVQNALDNFLQLEWQVGAAVISVRDFVNFILVCSAAYVLSRVLRVILAEEIFPRFHMPRGVPDALELLARYGVLLFGFLLALTSAGVNLSQVTLAVSALGVGIGFGLQNIVNNFVSGLILVFEHPIQVGDFVEVGTHFGQVRRIGFRASVVRTLDGAEVIIPNAELIGTKVINWSLSDHLRRVTIQVPVRIGTDPDQVIGILLAVARSHADVLAKPSPSAVLDQFGDSALKFLLRCWTQSERFGSVRNALTLAVDKAFQEAGIQIPFAQTDVHVHWSDKPGEGIGPIEKPK